MYSQFNTGGYWDDDPYEDEDGWTAELDDQARYNESLFDEDQDEDWY